jgi:protein O-mannosyl-transferase
MQSLRKPSVFFLCLLALALWGALIYSNTFEAPFVFDDEKNILDNHALRQGTVNRLWRDVTFRKRIVGFYSFVLHYRAHGYDVTGYHLANLFIHIINALLVVWFVRLLFKTPRLQKPPPYGSPELIALLSGWLFISHPVQTQAVTYISQRFTSLAALFYLLSVCLYIKGRMDQGPVARRIALLALATVAAVLGMFTKEIVFTLPLVLLLVETVFFKREKTALPEKKSIWRSPLFYIAIVFCISVWVFSLFSVNVVRIITAQEPGLTFDRHIPTQFRVIGASIGLLFFPLNQNLDYDIIVSRTVFQYLSWLNLLFLVFVFLFGLRVIRRFPLVGFGIFWFFLTLSITNIIPQPDFIFEHWLYLPSVGFMIAVSVGLFHFIKQPRVLALCSGGIILLFSLLTYQRNTVWADTVTLWADAAAKSPNKPRPHVNLGRAYRKKGAYDKAMISYLNAFGLERMNKVAKAQTYVNMGALYGDMGEYDKEIFFSLQAIELDPKNAQAHSNLGYAYALIQDYAKAIEYGEKAVKIAPRFEEGWNNLGVIYGNMGQYEKAAELFDRAVKINPYYEQAARNLEKARNLVEKKNHE